MPAKSTFESYNREQNSRNNDRGMGMRGGSRSGGTGRDTNSVAGSVGMTQTQRTQKSPSMGGSAHVKALGKVASGRPDTAKVSKTVR